MASESVPARSRPCSYRHPTSVLPSDSDPHARVRNRSPLPGRGVRSHVPKCGGTFPFLPDRIDSSTRESGRHSVPSIPFHLRRRRVRRIEGFDRLVSGTTTTIRAKEEGEGKASLRKKRGTKAKERERLVLGFLVSSSLSLFRRLFWNRSVRRAVRFDFVGIPTLPTLRLVGTKPGAWKEQGFVDPRSARRRKSFG